MTCIEVLQKSCILECCKGKAWNVLAIQGWCWCFMFAVFGIDDVMSSKVLRDMEHGWPGQLASKTT